MASEHTPTAAELKIIIERYQEAMKTAEEKEEQEAAVSTPVAPSKSNTTCARASEEEAKKTSPTSIIANTPKSADMVAERKADYKYS